MFQSMQEGMCILSEAHGKRFCRKHLNNRLRIAQEQEDKEAFNKINAIIQREQQHKFCCKLN